MIRLFAALAAILAAAAADGAEARLAPKAWIAGAYSFSDELGGFSITGISGTGTSADPIVIKEEFSSATPATLTIRAVRPIRPYEAIGNFATGFMHMRIVALNASGQAWVEFEFELQEQLGQPSVFGDGLSFDQRKTEEGDIASDGFATFKRDFEPYDRIRFLEGHVDPMQVASFSFFVTDFTPKLTFFLVQDPRIPYS